MLNSSKKKELPAQKRKKISNIFPADSLKFSFIYFEY